MTIMSENQSAPKGVPSPTGPSCGWRVTADPKRLWGAHLKWSIEHQAFAHLRSMRDAQLQDIELVRLQSAVAPCLGLDLERHRTASLF